MRETEMEVLLSRT